MNDYFRLQYTMLNRRLTDFGLSRWLAYVLLPVAFFLLSAYMFSQTAFAGYLYVLLALSLISRLSDPVRNDFLRSVFSASDYRRVRATENLACSTPFLLFLVYQGDFLFAAALVTLAPLLGLVNFRTTGNLVLPTPFGKKPFEFTVGFRKTFFLFPCAYFLTFMAVYAENVNLGIFSLILVGVVCLSFYATPEAPYFVWNFDRSPKSFLLEKIKTCFLYFTLLSLPIILSLSLFFWESMGVALGILCVCCVYLATIILAKYSAYPHDMNVAQGILIAISLLFPPVLIGVIPFLYAQAVQKLTPFLYDPN